MAQPERRTEERYPPTSDTYCGWVSPVVEDFGPAKIKNVSREGLGLVLMRKVEAGMRLTLTINNTAKSFSKLVLVHVVHVTAMPGGTYLIGGTFEPALTYDELRTIIF